MKIIITILASCLFLISCNNTAKSPAEITEKEKLENQRFFPVTAFLRGEVYSIKKNGINPLLYTTANEHTDSTWLKIEELDAAVQEFLHPIIDSVNLVTLFTEKSFMDQSINAVTLTYDPTGILPDSMKLRHWDVYIDPKSGKVKRIYMVKEIDKTKTLQLTWVSSQWCKITSFITDEKGLMKIEKEEKLIWDF
jgi:hypothetical protein